MDGEIIQQRSSYQQGLVLGLTMAEIMLLLVFCLLIAMASFLKTEQNKLADVQQQLQQQQAQNERDHDVVTALHQNTALAEKLQNMSGLTDPKELDKYWRELVDSQTAMAELDKNGVSIKELRDRIADIEKLRSNGIDIDKALRDADVVGAINRTMTKPGQPPVSTLAILDAIERGKAGLGPSGHQWSPIISLSEAGGYADVLVCAKLRRYYSYPQYGDPVFVDGICFWYKGVRIENFPERHSDNCTTKHQDTKQWFKHTVRILKNLRNTLIEKKVIEDGLAPSYFIEGLMYNVPKEYFGGTEQLNFRDVLNYVLATDRDKFVSANEQFKLLGNGNVTWPPANCQKFLNVVKAFNDAS
jgi:hypothetical protein